MPLNCRRATTQNEGDDMTLREEIMNLTEDKAMDEKLFTKAYKELKTLLPGFGKLPIEEYFRKNGSRRPDGYLIRKENVGDIFYSPEEKQLWGSIFTLFDVVKSYEDVSFGIKGRPNEITNKLNGILGDYEKFKRFCKAQPSQARKYYSKHAL